MIVEFEIGYGFGLLALQRVRASVLVATETVGIDQLQHPDLLVFKVQPRIGQACDALAAQMTGEAGKFFPDIGMGDVGGWITVDAGQRIEVVSPARCDAGRVLQPVLVQGLEIGNIAATQEG